MSRRQDARKDSLLPLELLLVGGWIAVTVVQWLARQSHVELLRETRLALLGRLLPRTTAEERLAAMRFCVTEIDRLLAFRVGLGEAILGAFLVLLALRRHAHGLGLALPFCAFTIALAFAFVLSPDAARLGAAARMDALTRVYWIAYALEVLKVLVLFTMFLLVQRSVRTR